MISDLPNWIIAAIGFSGVVIGLILRPFIEEWFSRQRKTLHVRVSESSVFRSPHEKVLLTWEKRTLSKIYQTGFLIQNKTGRTLRNVSIEIQAPRPTGDEDFYSVYLAEGSGCRWEEVEYDAEGSLFEFEYLQPNTSVSGAMISTFTDQIEFVSHDDFEIRVRHFKPESGWKSVLTGVAATLALVSFSTAIAGAVQ